MKFFPLLVRLQAVIYVQQADVNPGASFDINTWHKQERGGKKHVLQKISQKVETKTDGEGQIIEDKHKETRAQMYYLRY